MYEALHFKNTDDRRVLFCSDTHWGHDKDFIYGPRGYANVADHDSDSQHAWNLKVGENDTVCHLGDAFLGQNAYFRFLEVCKNLKFRELYISPGNHEGGWKQFYQDAKTKIFNLPKDVTAYPLRVELRRMFGSQYPENKTVIFMPNLYELFVNGQFIVCSHYPIASWNGIGKGAWMISGHVHGRFEGSNKKTTTGGKILDVGPESVGAAPVSFDEVREIMATKAVKVVDHHGENTNYSF